MDVHIPIHIATILSLIYSTDGQVVDKPRGPWELVFKVVSGKWESGVTGFSSFWELYTSLNTYNTGNSVPDKRDFSLSSDHFKSELIEDWEDGLISVQAIKISLFKNNAEKMYVVFDGSGKSKTTWFKCNTILYSSYNDLPDNTLPADCPGRTTSGQPLTIMKTSHFQAPCSQTTGWLIVADTSHTFSICPSFMPADVPKPYFKYSTLSTVGNLETELESADSLAIFFQVWDLVFKGIEGIKPSAAGLSNLTGLFTGELVENDNSDWTVQNLQHSQSSQTFKSGVVNLWDTFFIDTVKYSMYKSAVEKAYVVFDGVNTNKESWFHEDNILYSSYGTDLTQASLTTCSIEGDTFRNWQIQSVSDVLDCTSSHQLGWMLVKEPKNNGTCSWDTSTIKKKPYFLYNTGSTPASPSTFQYADVMAVFVHGWRLVFKVAAGGDLPTSTSIYTLWTNNGGLNELDTDAKIISTSTSYKSSIIDLWNNYYIRAVKIAAYKDGLEVFNVIFDATAGSDTSWFDCKRILYTTVNGLTSQTAIDNSYTCSMEGMSSSFRFLIGTSTDCGTISAIGVFNIFDADSSCSSRNDLPQFVYSNYLDATFTDSTSSMLADTFAIFVDMPNCYSGTCSNGGTCQDLGGQYRCFCSAGYYGDTCTDLDGTYSSWSEWSSCSVTCDTGTVTRTRTCEGTQGNGICVGESEETLICTLSNCPIDGGFTIWSLWTACSSTCDEGTQSRTRTCTNPSPQYGGADCVGDTTEEQTCLEVYCPIDGGFSIWTTWSDCSQTCDEGIQSRSRDCTNPSPQYGGADCVGETTEDQSCLIINCPIDGGFTIWSSWTDCSQTCDEGLQSRTRTCTNPSPQYGGADCVGETTEDQSCLIVNCPIDGGFTVWSQWSDCSQTCDEGTQSRTRTCTNPSPQYGGADCVGDIMEEQTCLEVNCPIDGGYTDWSQWSECSQTCDEGTQSRTRTCTNPSPQYGGADCVGSLTDEQSCVLVYCPIDGGFSVWTTWSDCSQTCDEGIQSRSRDCTNPSPQYGGADCVGKTTEDQSCLIINCPIDGEFTIWSQWSGCSLTCDEGTQSRTRTCTDPSPQYGGTDCVGDTTEEQPCLLVYCPIDGGYTTWTPWSDCSLTCDEGIQSRSRDCTNPSPQHGGADCVGETAEDQTCLIINCPIDGGFTIWSSWTECSQTCDEGVQSRTRTCTDPSPQYGGADCIGASRDEQSCLDFNCPIDGGFSPWTVWSDCSLTCDEGIQSRSRDCINPSPQYGGADCVGETTEDQLCLIINCPIDGGFTDWSQWTDCSLTCDEGTQSRTRTCTNPSPQYAGADCVGDTMEEQTCIFIFCPIDGGFTDWSLWSECSQTCDEGTQSRTRDCTNPSPQYGGADCVGDIMEEQTCLEVNCPIDGGFTEWSQWSECSQTCDEGTQTRTRTCTNPSPQYGGADCVGDITEDQTCLEIYCPIDGGFTDWGQWSECSQTCDEGTQIRTRTCTNPSPQYGGANCIGDIMEEQTCLDVFCPIDGGFTDWSQWSECSHTCDEGTQSRTRTCTNPSPQYGGVDCLGDTLEEQTCLEVNCPVDGGFTIWSEWSDCSQTCDEGTKSRTRTCTNPSPQFGGADCVGDSMEEQTCLDLYCPIDGDFTIWSEWSVCSQTCDEGTQSRTRTCTNPSPQYGGADCVGEIMEEQICLDIYCPINGGFSFWSHWGDCSSTCDEGTQSRTRTCTDPSPQYGGAECVGDTMEEQICLEVYCPIDGGFAAWNQWSDCSQTCGEGTQSRTRTCTNPSPQYGGADCVGDTTEEQICLDAYCPIDGGFTIWSQWGDCSLTCNEGTQSRIRSCTNPSPQYGGADCVGETLEEQTCLEVNCPVDGGFSIWSEWGDCSLTCNEGIQSRTRTCTNPSPQYGGAGCIGDIMEEQTCLEVNCPIDGGFTIWSEWSDCTHTCNEGLQSRIRTCTDPSPQYGGADCVGDTMEEQTCLEVQCPIDGEFTIWSLWTECSLTCDEGTQSRTRTCTNPSPQYGGADCIGDTMEEQICLEVYCPIDGGFSIWTTWSDCSLTCDEGTQSRSRDCTNPSPQYGGADCVGDSMEEQACLDAHCPIDGGFTMWSQWSDCSLTCDEGIQSRTRTCTNPIPQYGGDDCIGDISEEQTCVLMFCPIDGGFTIWSSWTDCSMTCNEGTQSRTRTCTDPSPQYGGADCIGNTMEEQTCLEVNCPIDGEYTDWSQWSECSQTCDEGTQSRIRTCTNPSPQFGGADCVGDIMEEQTCLDVFCPINGDFSIWSEWSDCSQTCDEGTQSRTRLCTNPSPQYGGADCVGEIMEEQSCVDAYCPIDGGFTNWSEWSDCSQTCNEGLQSRTRLCTNPSPQYGGAGCIGDTLEEQTCLEVNCPIDGGFTIWSSWTDCSQTCDEGTQSRTRTCSNPSPQYDGADCVGNSMEEQMCLDAHCPINGDYTSWSEWSSCSVTCGDGISTRSRNCTNPEPAFGGEQCVGPAIETQHCNDGICPLTGFSDWSEWSSCSVTCDPGTQQRNRVCENIIDGCEGPTEDFRGCIDSNCPVNGYWTDWEEWSVCSVTCETGTRTRGRTCIQPQYGGNPCTGSVAEQIEVCVEQDCPVNGEWGGWSSWSICDVSCNGGTRSRTRVCSGIEHGGLDCVGDNTEHETCNDSPCPTDGYWSAWAEWAECTVTCDTGTQNRNRVCIPPENGGLACTGASTQTRFCTSDPCPVDGYWTTWNDWSECSAPCDGGTRDRSRTCIEEQYGGQPCVGDEVHTEECNIEPCPVDGYWNTWSEWGQCSVSCLEGTHSRTRTCIGPSYNGAECIGSDIEYETCNNGLCPVNGEWSDWTEWSVCTLTCGGGTYSRSRSCNEPENNGVYCEGDYMETDTCNIQPCPVNGIWTQWSEWSQCSKSCYVGTHGRQRTCTEPLYGGKYCDGEIAEMEFCNSFPCPVDWFWTSWTSWSTCTVTCGTGSKSRSRNCIASQYGGQDCPIEDFQEETEFCNTQQCPEWSVWTAWSVCTATCNGGSRRRTRECLQDTLDDVQCPGHAVDLESCGMEVCPPVHGGWSSWSIWTDCSVTCGSGEIIRSRTCTEPSPQWNGEYCNGLHIEVDFCTEEDCPDEGLWSNWSDWSECSNMTTFACNESCDCGVGLSERHRKCYHPTAQDNMYVCEGVAIQTKTCAEPCYRIKCSSKHPEACQIVLTQTGNSKNGAGRKTTSVIISVLIAVLSSKLMKNADA